MHKLVVLTGFIFLFSQLTGQNSFYLQLADSALVLTKQAVVYDAAYTCIAYPNGDVAPDKGVCSDVIIRAYRKLGIDLQLKVHEDMVAHFNCYPNIWGLSKPDKNIDHRRVPNLMTFFSRYGVKKPITNHPEDYQPGDIVCWNLGSGITHIGIVSDIKSNDGSQYQIIHNIGYGQLLEDCLFRFKIIGHFRYDGKK